LAPKEEGCAPKTPKVGICGDFSFVLSFDGSKRKNMKVFQKSLYSQIVIGKFILYTLLPAIRLIVNRTNGMPHKGYNVALLVLFNSFPDE
jgi:hypothetical protein